MKKTTNKIKQKFYWYRLKDSVKLWIQYCTVCGAKSPTEEQISLSYKIIKLVPPWIEFPLIFLVHFLILSPVTASGRLFQKVD